MFERRKWVQWISSHNIQKEVTKSGNLKQVDILTIMKLVKESWDKIPTEIIKKSFLKYYATDDSKDFFFSDYNESSLTSMPNP